MTTDVRVNRLLEAVEQLTKLDKRGHQQNILENGNVIGHQKVTIQLPPLLEQLDSAIRSSMGGNTPGASLAFEGAVLNAAALFTAMRISAQIRDWCRIAKTTVVKNSTKDLIAWYLAASNLSHDVESFHIKAMNSWAGQIRAMLNPSRERELPNACPGCDATEWWDMADGMKYLHPLIIRYRPSGANMIKESKALCRACEKVWGVRELAYELEQIELRRAEDG